MIYIGVLSKTWLLKIETVQHVFFGLVRDFTHWWKTHLHCRKSQQFAFFFLLFISSTMQNSLSKSSILDMSGKTHLVPKKTHLISDQKKNLPYIYHNHQQKIFRVLCCKTQHLFCKFTLCTKRTTVNYKWQK